MTIRKMFKSKRGGEFGIGILTSVMDVATANNTVAIVMAGPIAKEVSQHYEIRPERTASLMDIFACIWQGVIPYGAQLLIAAGLSGIGSITIIPYLYYQGFLLIAVLVVILVGDRKRQKRK